MVLTNPGWLWALALVALSALPLLSNRRMLTRRAKALSLGMRAVALGLAALTLTEPAWLEGKAAGAPLEPGKGTLHAVDVSDSVAPAEIERALGLVKGAMEGKEAQEVILFGSTAYRVKPAELESLPALRGLDWLKTLEWDEGRGRREGSHLEKALRTAAELSVRRLVIYTDGNETLGEAERALGLLRARGISLSVEPLEPLEPDALYLAGIRLPEDVLEGKEFEGALTVHCAGPGRARVEVRESGRIVEQKTLELSGGDTVLTFTDELSSAGIHAYEAVVTPLPGTLDGRREDNSLHAAVRAIAVPKTLLISEEPGRIGAMLDAAKLRHQDMTPKELDSRELDLDGFSCVILDDVDSADIAPRRRNAIAGFVKEHGGGLLMTGGDKGFGAGGWAGSEVEKVLPVDSTPKGYDRGLGLIVLLDSSGSMTGFPIDYARRATREIIGLMRGRWLGVINFSHVAETAVSFQVIGTDSYVVRTDIDSILPGGGTLFYRPLSQALDILQKVPLDQRHILFLSDGEAADFFMVRTLYSSLRAARVKVSTMAVGRYVNGDNLEELADATGGRYYRGEDFSKLPEMFKAEVKRISGPPVVQASFRPVRSGSTHPLAAALPSGPLPELHGHDATSAKARAEVLLTSPRGDPILAYWNVGVGKSAAFTGSFHGKWGRDWAAWPEASRFLSVLVGELGRLDTSDYHVTATGRGGEGRVVVDAIDSTGRYLNFQELVARLAQPDGRSSALALLQSGPGRYEGTFPMERAGVYRLRVFRREGGAEVFAGEGAAALPAPAEYRPAGRNQQLLDRLVLRGGAGPSGAAESGAGVSYRPDEVTPLWPLTATLALLVLLVEIVCRRLGLFSGAAEAWLGATSTSESAGAFLKIAEKYLRVAREMDDRGEHGKASEAYLRARSYFLKAEQAEKAQMMWDRYRLMEDRRTRGG